MATQVVMEALSPTMEDGRLVEWKKQPGESVAVGDVLAEVETDKAVMELLARAGGVLLGHLVPAGATVPVASPVAYIGAAGEAMPGAAPAAAAAAPVTPAAPVALAAPAVAPGAPAPAAPVKITAAAPAAADAIPATPAPAPGMPVAGSVAGAAANGSPARIKASPLARKIASEQGVDLRFLTGSGPEGRIVQKDVESAIAAGTAPMLGAAPPAAMASAAVPVAAVPAAPALPTRRLGADGPAFENLPLSKIRQTIATRLVQSIGPIPTFYLTAEVDMERVAELRAALPPEPKVTFNDIILKSVANALAQHPECNAWWQGDHIRRWYEVHLAVAVAIEDGLITPVIRHADRLSLREIAAQSRDLVARAKVRKLAPDEYTGSTFSVSNLGMFGIDEFTAIINPPEAGILAIGRIEPKAVVVDGAVQVRRRLRITLSCDHRIIDGAAGARFLQTLVRMLENPLALVW